MSKRYAPACGAGLVTLLCAGPALAQVPQVLLTSPLPLSRVDVAANATGTHIAVLTTEAIDPADTDGVEDLYVRDVAAATWQRVAAATLLRPGDEGLALWGLSDDGRYLGYQTTPDACGAVRRLHLATTAIDTVFAFCDGDPVLRPLPAGLPAGAMSRDGSTFAVTTRFGTPVSDPWTLHTVRVGESPLALGLTCHFQPQQPLDCGFPPALSADGRRVAHVDFVPNGGGLLMRDTGTGDVVATTAIIPTGVLAPLTGTPDLGWLAQPATIRAGVFQVATGTYDPLVGEGRPAFALTDDGQQVLIADVPTTPRQLVHGAAVFDRRWQMLTPLEGEPLALTGDGHAALTLVRGVGTWSLTRWVLDADDDGLPDAWERAFFLDPTDPTDAASDPNADGLTNLASYLGDRHPTATAAFRRYFAEGAAGSFRTTVSLFNPSSEPATAHVQLLGADGEQWATVVPLGPFGRDDVWLADFASFGAFEFSIIVDANRALVVERRVTTGTMSGAIHASAAAPVAATTWYFAEGATVDLLQTFYLLQNPGDTPVDLTFEYLFQPHGRVFRAYTLAPRSRTTIWANQSGAEFNNAEFALVIHASAPIVAERSMYRRLARSIGSGSANAVGVTAPSTTWRFAEGAVGDFFDTFILVANPGTSDASVTAEFRPEGVAAYARTFTVPAGARYTIWVDQEGVPSPVTAVSVALTADQPIVAERVMWWDGFGGPFGWTDGHAEFGATSRGHRFGAADLELDATRGIDTFLLVDADTQGTGSGTVRVTLYPTTGPPIVRTLPVVDGRNTLWMAALVPELDGQRFSAVVEAIDGPPGTPLLSVERAMYTNWLVFGAAARATPLTP